MVQRRQSLQERPDASLKFWIVCGCGQEHTDAPYLLAPLCLRRERPSRRAAEKRDEVAPFHAVPQRLTVTPYSSKVRVR
jgi:hypothetical protein